MKIPCNPCESQRLSQGRREKKNTHTHTHSNVNVIFIIYILRKAAICLFFYPPAKQGEQNQTLQL